jgi:hypothetical protein
MFMRVPLLLVAALSSSGLLACAVPAPDPGPDRVETSSTATAIVVVERTAGPGDAVRGDSVVARFVRVRQGSVDDPALRVAGIATDIPNAGSCFAPTDSAPTLQGRGVELLDVGQITLSALSGESSAKNTVLLPRSMPDPAGVVSGVFYSSRAEGVFAAGSRVALRSSGGADLLDGFSAAVTAPHELGEVQATPTANGVDVVWDAADADPRDLVYVDVVAPASRIVMRCASSDVGHVVVPQVTGALTGYDDVQLAVHRVHREAFKAKGIEPGEVRFDVAKVVALRK